MRLVLILNFSHRQPDFSTVTWQKDLLSVVIALSHRSEGLILPQLHQNYPISSRFSCSKPELRNTMKGKMQLAYCLLLVSSFLVVFNCVYYFEVHSNKPSIVYQIIRRCPFSEYSKSHVRSPFLIK